VDFALSISQVSSQMLARRLLGEEAIEIDPLLKVQKLSRVPLAGHHPAELGIRERTGCSVVAVERGDEVMVEFGADFRFAPDDGIYVSGSSEAVRRFAESLGAA
jgi:K+/H+ antiporter YhaU regulatory subunit KhtT